MIRVTSLSFVRAIRKSLAARRLRQVERFFEDHMGGFFVCIGANDGKQGDPIADLLEQNVAWNGILVEPLPDAFARLASNYPDQERFTLKNVAVGPEDGFIDLYRLSESCPLPIPAMASQLASFDPDHIVKHVGEAYRPFVEKVRTQCLTCESLMGNEGVSKVNLLLIDTEGYDFEVLKQFPLKSLSPELVIYEHKHLEFFDRLKSVQFMKSLGYGMSFDFDNVYCTKES